jgi:thioredoxin 1
MMVEITAAEFEKKVIGSEIPVVVDVYGTTCVSCHKVDAVLARVAPRYNDRVSFFRVNIEENPGVARKFHIMSLPTLLFFKAGEVSRAAVGSISDMLLSSGLVELLDEES